MSVDGSSEGIRKCNSVSKKIEPIIDTTRLRSQYLFGVNIVDNDGKELGTEAYQQFIDNAISILEHDLDISVSPVIGEIEYKDYRYNDYVDWGFMYLNNYPAIRVQKIEMVFYKDEAGDDIAVQRIPDNWIRFQQHDAIIRLIPNARFPSSLQVGAHGFFPELLRSNIIPHAWRVVYDHGFVDGGVPVAINHAIGMLAAVQAYIIGGGLVVGVGIASNSISMDGLSQAINTTQSAENHAFSAQMNNYNDLLFGKREKDPGLVGRLRTFYKGEVMGII